MEHASEPVEDAHVAREIGLEQAYADRLYARVDDLMGQIQVSLDDVQGSQDAATHQNRSERDAFMALYEDRLALLRTVSENVVFGRLDTDEDERHYIGRIGLFTAEREQLLVDWRAPAAAAYYQATSLERLGVRLRRHLISQGRTVVGLEDDVLDQSLLETDDEVVLQGEGALLAAVSSQRTGRMGDIVATIQGEQDRIIRSANRGVLVVQGGPGTGKTAVALHRAAYLLYTHRRRLEHSGVLIVAPTRGFLRYIERVLPSLGESGVVMSTPGGLFPGVETTVHDHPAVARLKGDGAMAELLSRAVKQRQLVPEEDLELRIDGTPVRVTRRIISEAGREARATHKPHNAARAVFVRAALDRLVEQYEGELARRGTTVLPEDRPGYLDDLRRDPQVRRTLNLAWLPYSPESFLRVLLNRPERLRAAAPRTLAQQDLELLVRPKDSPWTIEDVPLLDEVAELLGEDDSARRAESDRARSQRDADLSYARSVIENIDTSGIVRDEDLADRMESRGDGRTLAERAAADRAWTYGHIVVDEAQEHSAMMWRCLMRRCPSKSFTVVGDVAQTSSAGGTDSWEDALAPYVEDRLEVEPLSVNYRTPRRIMDVAQAVAEAQQLPITEVTSVREGDWPLGVLRADEAGLPAAVAEIVAAQQDAGVGRLAVLCPGELMDPVLAALRGHDGLERIGTGSAGIDLPIAVMTAQDAKGLEFDGVTVVEPAAMLEGRDTGPGDLYVAMTRATQRLDVVHALPVPDGFPHDG
ncbi:HelD family protein [Brachybacterium endophyticum]|uniref:HelD family protein n=1 Tax=Brachybacterium endophyticum TaxID=2182385 RepID=UPI001F0CC1ED|nr:AAA family ATPase [Brachybacterium endophyticum]